ncbi:50S ribosomal protein L35ae [Candidatus Woesearchaeota archaeon]|nr:50S ribosomal protein L35ae [Candidatus Woesearchaeota archaeon]
MKAVIVNFRGSRRRKSERQMILTIEGLDKEKSKALLGKKVAWTSPGKNKTTIAGTVSALHGGKGAVRVIFERGMPGQAIGQEVTFAQ